MQSYPHSAAILIFLLSTFKFSLLSIPSRSLFIFLSFMLPYFLDFPFHSQLMVTVKNSQWHKLRAVMSSLKSIVDEELICLYFTVFELNKTLSFHHNRLTGNLITMLKEGVEECLRFPLHSVSQNAESILHPLKMRKVILWSSLHSILWYLPDWTHKDLQVSNIPLECHSQRVKTAKETRMPLAGLRTRHSPIFHPQNSSHLGLHKFWPLVFQFSEILGLTLDFLTIYSSLKIVFNY